MSVASTIRWRRFRALLIPSIAADRTVQPGMPTQRHLIVLWFGFGVQLTIGRMPDWLVRR